MDHKFQIVEEDIPMEDVHISGKENGAIGNPSLPSRNVLSVTSSANSDDRYSDSPAQLVYALGQIDYDFVSRSRRDSIKHRMQWADRKANRTPEKHEDMLEYLNANDHLSDASALQWTLTLEGRPIYVIEPSGAFAVKAYTRLLEFLKKQVSEGEDQVVVCIPGIIIGETRNWSGLTLPVVAPEIRGMQSWTTKELVADVVNSGAKEEAKRRKLSNFLTELQEKKKAEEIGVSNFLRRVHNEIHNLGREPRERALNFAATMAWKEVKSIYTDTTRKEKEQMALDTIEVERSAGCRPDSDCWDVKLIFFFPERPVQTVRRVYRFTVDVKDVMPVAVGQLQSWSIAK